LYLGSVGDGSFYREDVVFDFADEAALHQIQSAQGVATVE
jgi:hypothetical protein